jgi:hypothetical protein
MYDEYGKAETNAAEVACHWTAASRTETAAMLVIIDDFILARPFRPRRELG